MATGVGAVVTLSRYLLEVSAGATTRDTSRSALPGAFALEGRKREDTRLRLAMTPGVNLSSRTSAAADMCGGPDAATEPPPGSVCRERSVCPGGTSNQAMWCLILRADRAMEASYFSRFRGRLIGQCEVAVRSFLPGRSAARLALFARRDQTASSLPLRGRDDPGGPLA